MAWDFETDPEFKQELHWIDDFVRSAIEPVDFVIGHPCHLTDPIHQRPVVASSVRRNAASGPAISAPSSAAEGFGWVKLARIRRARCSGASRSSAR